MKLTQRQAITIGYDAKRAACNRTGLGNYSRYVIQTMAVNYPANKYLLYTPKVTCPERIEGLLGAGNIEVQKPKSTAGRLMGSLWRSLEITRLLIADGVDLYHGLSNELPLNIARGPVASVVTIHDLIYRRVPRDYKPVDRALYDYKYRRSAQAADRVIAISERTKLDLISDYNIDPGKIDVIYQGCDPLFYQPITPEQRNDIHTRYNLPERFIVSVGTVQSRKNQLLAVKALRGLPADVCLAIVGGRDRHYGGEIDRYIAANHLGERVRWLGHVGIEDLPALYSAAVCSSYTSRYEGFGIPLIESIATGTPVIAATGSCLEEAGGPGAIYISPDDVEAYIDAANRLIDNSWLRDKMGGEGKRYIKRFNPGDFARRTLECYSKAILAKAMN